MQLEPCDIHEYIHEALMQNGAMNRLSNEVVRAGRVVFQLLKISCLGLRVDEHDEFEGADTMEHNLPL